MGSLGLGSNRQEQAYLDYLVIVAEDLVDAFWPQIEALANELLNRELMSGAEVRTFLSAGLLARKLARTPARPHR